MEKKSKMVIAGASGLIGTALIDVFRDVFQLVILTRTVAKKTVKSVDNQVMYYQWGAPHEQMEIALEGTRYLINLAGAGIGDQRWTSSRKQIILESRVQSVQKLSAWLTQFNVRPEVIVQASAIGYYGFSEEKMFTENDKLGSGFLAEVASQWEAAARSFENQCNRLIILRLGVVLSHKGGAFPKMALPVKLGLGGRIGHGRQGMSFIHLSDVSGAIRFFLDCVECEGVYNLVAPQRVSQSDFVKQIAKKLKRPAFVAAPAFAIRLFLGEMGNELLLKGAFVIPERLLASGYRFQYPELKKVLDEMLT